MSSANPKTKGKFRTIGARLTLLGTLVTFGTCTVLCVALYIGVSLTLRQEVDTFLKGEVDEFLATAARHEGSDASLEQEVRLELGARTFADLAFRLFDGEGKLLISSEPDDVIAANWKPGPLDADLYRKTACETIQPPDLGHAYRLCSLRWTFGDGRTGLAQASYSLARMEESLGRFRTVCIFVLLLSLLVSLGIGRFLAARSLQPLRLITAKARRIGADQLDRRLPVSGTGDELDQLIQTLNDLLGRIERYVSQLRQFTADASHELRTPLAALRGATEVALSRERSAEGLRRVLEENISHFERLQKIAEDLLLLSRLDAGEQVLKDEDVDLGSAIAAAVDLYRPFAEERGIRLSVSGLSRVTIIGDSGRIRQVLCNLLDNAVKYSKEKGRIDVELSRVNGRACVSIQDDGMGIAQTDLPRVFDRFFRADAARASANGTGAGLGLSICRSIVHALHGEIRLQSHPGAGTTVLLELPVAQE